MKHFIKFLWDAIKGQTKALKMWMMEHFFHKLEKISFVGTEKTQASKQTNKNNQKKPWWIPVRTPTSSSNYPNILFEGIQISSKKLFQTQWDLGRYFCITYFCVVEATTTLGSLTILSILMSLTA